MSVYEQHNLLAGKPITSYAFNADKTHVVVSSNTNEAYIYAKRGSNWELEHVLSEHDLRITSVDWGTTKGNIVTCSQDRNAYVWKYDNKKNTWKPDLVLLRSNRSATCVKFNGLENKFAVGTGAKLIAVCYYDEANDWWISKHIKRPLEGTVLSVAWHPENSLLAVASTDMHVYIFYAGIKGMDTSERACAWGTGKNFGDLLFSCESNNRAWAHSISFSPSGDAVAWTSHDSTINYKSAHNSKHLTMYTKMLPFRSVAFVSDKVFVAAGYDFILFIFGITGDKITLLAKLGEGQEKRSMKDTTAFKMFKMLDSRAQDDSRGDADLKTVHKKTINLVLPLQSAGKPISHISSAADDGNLIIWDISNHLHQPVYT